MRGYEDYKEILNKFTQLLRKRIGDNLISLILHGSVARGAAKDESDIDLLIILKDAPAAYCERLEPVIEIELKLRENFSGAPPIFSSLILSKEEAMENRNIFLDMIEDSIILYDKDDFFRNRLKAMKNRLQQLGSRKFILKDNTWYWQLKPDMKAGEILEL
ncbi:MAG: nucleotidyltransferase domain-containing protein [Candidatus Methanoperedenaceae archaeon]|nr:nucleotidyltransferase domain-containing protein [Euryarchaeota archaeon]MCG2728388.1 nucleotidyltransferase domain-containing protein [Candidatus Methanoperedenaceae archaeon]